MAYDTNHYNNNPRAGGDTPRYGTPRSGDGSGSRRNNDVQTDGIILQNEKVGKFLKTRFWAKCMGIDIGTYPPGSQLDRNLVRNAQTFSHVFSFSAIYELKDICNEVLESLKATNRFESTATEAGQKKDCILEISNGSNINMSPGIYLVLYKNVDAGKRTNNYEIYPFGSTKVFRNYDHNTGSYKEDIRATGDFKKFITCLEEAAKAFTMAQAHAISEVHKTDKLATFTALSAISAGMGIDISKAVAANSRVSGQSSYSKNNGQNQQPQQYQRRSAPGQWNRGGNYGGQPRQQQSQGGSQYGTRPQTSYQQTQQAMAAISDEPVDINIDAATLQNVSLNDFK